MCTSKTGKRTFWDGLSDVYDPADIDRKQFISLTDLQEHLMLKLQAV